MSNKFHNQNVFLHEYTISMKSHTHILFIIHPSLPLTYFSLLNSPLTTFLTILVFFIIVKMENDQIRKKVYMQTHTSSLINSKPTLFPQWISQNQLNFTSSYEFSCYNIQAETIQLLPRGQGEADVLLADFKSNGTDLQNELYYIYKDKQCFYLVHQPQEQPNRFLLYRKDIEQKSKIVQKFLDYIIHNQDEPMFSNQNLINRTQQLIEDIREDWGERQEQNQYQYDLENINGLHVVYECNFAVMMVELKKLNGIMLVNLARLQRESEKEYKCSFTAVNFQRNEPQLTQEDAMASKIIYLFPQKLIEIHQTSDITQFVFLTQHHLLLAKINYDLMELCILFKLKIAKGRNRVISAGISHSGEQDYIIGLVETNKPISIKNLKDKKSKRYMKLFRIQQRSIVEIKNSHYANSPKYQCQQGRTLKFLDDSQKTMNIKFSSNVVQSHYEISQSQNEQGLDFNNNIIMSVFNSMLNQEGRTQQKIIFDKESHRSQLFDNCLDATQNMSRNNSIKIIKDIAGFVTNKNMIVLWETQDAVLHICRVMTSREIEDKHGKEKEAQSHKNANKIMLKQKQMKDIYAQLMGNTIPPKQETFLDLQSRIQYIRRVELDLACSKISTASFSPDNYNLLIVASSGIQVKQTHSYSIFQLQLFTQLSNPDPNMFLKPIRHIYKNKPAQHIATSLVKQMPIFLTGNLVHTLQSQLIQGALSFDIHPYHLFMAVSFGFTTKVYAFQGTERLSSLHTINLQGIKQVKYSPLGNHLCLLSSKCIRVVDAYSFMLKFIINQKYSSFSRCTFSSNGLQFHTLSQNHCANIYNSFDYSKTETIRPTSNADTKPLFIASFSKYLQYCIVLQNGSMVVRYKPDAIVVTHDIIYRYMDGEKITTIQIDQKNGILFVGCSSGKLRAHLWPLKQNQDFDTYSQIRIGFGSISSLALSNLNYFLYVGSINGNTSKVKFVIDRDRGTSSSSSTSLRPHNPLFTESNLKYINMTGNSNVQKVYKFVLANSSSVNEQLPQKLRLQYKLSEVINKLNESMHKLKSQVKEEIQEKIKMTTSRFDINLYHHLNKMITTKLSTQYNEEQDANHKQIQEMRGHNSKELKEILALQNTLVKEKSILISNNVNSRNQLKLKFAKELKELVQSQEEELQMMDKKVKYIEKKTNCDDEEIFYLPNCSYDYKEEKNRLSRQLEHQNKQYYELRKECAYKETAINGMNSKKIKEESLQFKFQLQTTEMRKKYEYSRGIVSKLKVEIEQAEQKVHVMQTQASIIKSNAQFKKIANLEEMNDACSYKLWVKEKTQKEIHQLCVHLRFLQEFLQGKSSEMVDLVVDKAQKLQQIKTLSQQAAIKKHALKLSKLDLLDTKNKIKKINKTDYSAILSANLTPRQNPINLTSDRPSKNLLKSQSSRHIVKSNKDVSLFNSIMDKQMNFLKTTMKIHRRKIKNYGKENGELLTEFQKLKYENKNLIETQQIDSKRIQSLKKEIKNQEGPISPSKNNIEVQLVKTSFQKYLRNKESKRGYNSKYKTAANTPSCIASPPSID